MQTWQDKFYELAEIYLDTEALIKHACNKLLVSREEFVQEFELETNQTKREAYQAEGRKVVTRIRDSQDDATLADQTKVDELIKKSHLRKKQREGVKKSKASINELWNI